VPINGHRNLVIAQANRQRIVAVAIGQDGDLRNGLGGNIQRLCLNESVLIGLPVRDVTRPFTPCPISL
jgi:hypothetical protein